MGITTEKNAEMEHFLQSVMSLPLAYRGHNFTLFQLPNGDKVEIISPDGTNQHFAPDSVICGFQVEDIHQASQELVQAGIELVGPLGEERPGGYAWQHFRGPDGKLYELAYDPERS
jgi:hypothetical protein